MKKQITKKELQKYIRKLEKRLLEMEAISQCTNMDRDFLRETINDNNRIIIKKDRIIEKYAKRHLDQKLVIDSLVENITLLSGLLP